VEADCSDAADSVGTPVKNDLQLVEAESADTTDSVGTPVKNHLQLVEAESEEETVQTPSQNLQVVPKELQVTPVKGKVQYSLARFWSPSPKKEDVKPALEVF
jgi:hypothetical protein